MMDQRGADGDPLVTLEAICDINESLWAESENTQRAQKAAELKAKARQARRGRM